MPADLAELLTGERRLERAASARHVRLRRRRQVDADRAPALRHEAGDVRPARARRGDERAPRGRLRQPGTADRRPARRARAGDHDRRRVPLVRHAHAAVPARGRTRARPVHAQHGHRCLDGRRRRRAARRPQGRDRADPTSRDHRVDARESLTLSSLSTRWTSSISTKSRFREIDAQLRELSERLGLRDEVAIPIAALPGDNVVEPSERMPWWDGGTFLERLETIEIAGDRDASHRRFPGAVGDPADVGRASRLPRLRRPGRGRRMARG